MSNVLVSPELVKNLVWVRCLARENPLTVEFDECGFSVKDARTRMILHRCDSLDDLYLVHSSSSTSATPVALSTGVDLCMLVWDIPIPPHFVIFFGVFLSLVIK